MPYNHTGFLPYLSLSLSFLCTIGIGFVYIMSSRVVLVQDEPVLLNFLQYVVKIVHTVYIFPNERLTLIILILEFNEWMFFTNGGLAINF